MSESDFEPPYPAENKILWLYAFFGAGLGASCIPSIWAALLSLILIIGVFTAASNLKHNVGAESMAGGHALFIARTIWVGSVIGIFSMSVAIYYLLNNVDQAHLMPCLQGVVDGAPPPENYEGAQKLFLPCLDAYMKQNKSVFAISGLIGIAPVFVYFLIRYMRGVMRAIRGYRLANYRSWF